MRETETKNQGQSIANETVINVNVYLPPIHAMCDKLLNKDWEKEIKEDSRSKVMAFMHY